MLFALALITIFGRQGLVTNGFFGTLPGWDLELYGRTGILLALSIFAFPTALVVQMVSLLHTDGRLHEAAESMGASRWRVFWTVTIPGARYGIVSAAFVTFTLCFTDFGIPKIVGGDHGVLAVEVYKQVVGQQDFGVGAVVSLLLLAPTTLAFVADRLVQSRQQTLLSAQATPHPAQHPRGFEWALVVLTLAIALAIVAVLLVALLASLWTAYPYDLSLSFRHYDFTGTGASYSAYTNSVLMSALTAVAGTVATFGGSYLVLKTRDWPGVRRLVQLLAMVPLALPGLVLGIGYVFFFNRRNVALAGVELPVPMPPLYGGLALLVLCNVVHFYTVGYLTAASALRKLDPAFEAAAQSMAVPFWRTFVRVTVPLSLPAILEIALYYFVSSMCTVSALIFLYSSRLPLASVKIVHLDEAGSREAAAAMCLLILFTNVGVRALYELGLHLLRRRSP